MELLPKKFSSLNKEVLENNAGTTSEPVLVGIIPGQKGTGAVFVLKIEDKYFKISS